mmetsp:Transcript_122/g.261  ORF Transcript_122/g.261 Transcript_122/m.261 type:complete len:554 (-) Transcript_122:68-1729(-)|eukprot:CAMPEP_0197670412 /NCGR_PEP_ID=MMETSP1338-20131121/74515_1 /TAXON_ID=43686 ORGANISM="Pelagodinium beii, Strain RCC1491" /NCGR_SAMPLE_ID=MMETSP1338 /ASSEMBLY_ACC=CAM_ASM_000754 /LENGTH=553 /DNA_ID=CAMNT_0043250149 /DNA_START=36 /DNA_END=1697 /DNA_ORIENTATION=-
MSSPGETNTKAASSTELHRHAKEYRRLSSGLSASNFDIAIGTPDVEGLSLRHRFSRLHSESGLGSEAISSPENFPRVARLMLQKQTRGWTTPDAEPVTAEQLTVLAPPPNSPEASETAPPDWAELRGRRRMSDPVLAMPRSASGDGVLSSQEIQSAIWREWQDKCVIPSWLLDQEADAPTRFSELEAAPAPIEKATEDNTQLQPEESPVPPAPSIPPTLLPHSLSHVGSREDEVDGVKSPVAAELRKAVTEALSPSGSSKSPSAVQVMQAMDVQPDAFWKQPENVLILVDWDDTMLPTTWLATRPWFRQWVRQQETHETALQGADEADRRLIGDLDQAARRFILAASRLGKIFCVTLAQQPWVERSMKAYLPRTAEVWEAIGIQVSYANKEAVEYAERLSSWCEKPAVPGHLEASVLKLQMRSDQKRKVMHRLLRNFYKKTDDCWLNVVSFGDGAAERSALQEIAFWHENPPSESGDRLIFRVKSVQLLEEPDCDQLRAELQVLQEWLPVLANLDQDLDTALGVGDDQELQNANQELLLLARLQAQRKQQEFR